MNVGTVPLAAPLPRPGSVPFGEPLSARHLEELRQRLPRLWSPPQADPNASVIVPVGSPAGLQQVFYLLADLACYEGFYSLECLLALPAGQDWPPAEKLELLEALGLRLVFIPAGVWEQGALAARAFAAQAARAGVLLHFASDTRLPDPTALLDWYVGSLSGSYQLAYSRVDFYGLPERAGVRLSLRLLDGLRLVKRRLLGVPTPRGSNYAITRALFLDLYEAGKLSDDTPVGLAARLAQARSRYSSDRRLRACVSAHKFNPRTLLSPARMLRRLRLNLRALPAGFRPGEWLNWKVFSDEPDTWEKGS